METRAGNGGGYSAGPLSPEEIDTMLETARVLLGDDREHDIFNLLDVLAEDHYPALDRDGSYQLARTVLTFIVGIGANETTEPVQALDLWHRRNVDPRKPETLLHWAVSETIKHVSSTPRPQPEAG